MNNLGTQYKSILSARDTHPSDTKPKYDFRKGEENKVENSKTCAHLSIYIYKNVTASLTASSSGP
jgi:hypothetical protein